MNPPDGAPVSPSIVTLGTLTARALRGAWRATTPPPTLGADELELIAPHLLATGTAGLAWWAVKDDEALTQSPAAALLQERFRAQALQTRLHELRLGKVLDLAGRLGIDPLLVKGWSVARGYPSRGLRPCGDIDLAIGAHEHERLQEALDQRPNDDDWIDVDLEHRFLTTDASPLRNLNVRAGHVILDGRQVRVASPEDQLRLVCVHYLRAGGWQARALCDVALLLEARTADLSWQRVLGNSRHRQWVTVAAGLAEQLLGADLTDTPLTRAAAAVPGWVRRHVLHGFGTTAHDHPTQLPPFRLTPSAPALARQLRARWDSDGLAVTMHHRRPIPSRTPIANQCFDLAYRAVALAVPVKMPRARRDESPELAL